MKRFIILFVALCLPLALFAQQEGDVWLKDLDTTLGNRFAMEVEVNVADEPIMGYFMVDGDGYYISLGIMEVYSDGKLRHEVNNERKEVTIDSVDLSSYDLLTNPTHAFDFVGEEFAMSVVEQSSRECLLSLKPRHEALGIVEIKLVLCADAMGVKPQAIAYDYDGVMVALTLRMADVSNSEIPRWDKRAYSAYDIVSFL
jgi:hypothetical protein